MVSKSEVNEESNLAEVSMNEKAYKTRQNTVRSKKDNDSSWMALTDYMALNASTQSWIRDFLIVLNWINNLSWLAIEHKRKGWHLRKSKQCSFLLFDKNQENNHNALAPFFRGPINQNFVKTDTLLTNFSPVKKTRFYLHSVLFRALW